MDCSKFFLKFSRSSTEETIQRRITRDKTLRWLYPRTIHEVKKFGVNQILVPPSEKFLDGCAAIEDLASSREDEDDGFGQFGDK